MPELRDVATDQEVNGLRAKLVFDRDTASRFGITPSTIDNTLYDAYGQRQVSTMFTQLNQYHVVLEVQPGFHTRSVGSERSVHPLGGGGRDRWRRNHVRRIDGDGGPGTVQRLGGRGSSAASAHRAGGEQQQRVERGVRRSGCRQPRRYSPTATRCRSRAFTHMETTSVPITVNHQGQFPVVTLSFNLAPNASLGDAVTDVNRVKEELNMPASIQGAFQGTAQAFQARSANEPMLILAALITVYIVLGVLYESYIHPLTILSTLPSAGVGALLALYI